MKPACIILICVVLGSFQDTFAQNDRKVKILWINPFTPEDNDAEGILSSAGDFYLYRRLETMCKNLVVKELLKISCQKSRVDEMRIVEMQSEKIAASGKSTLPHDYRIESYYTKASASNMYRINCKLLTKDRVEIARVGGTIKFEVIGNGKQERLNQNNIRPVAYKLAQEIFKEIQSIPFESEKLFIYPQFELDGEEDLKLYKKFMEHRLATLEVEDPQIRIVNQADATTWSVEITMQKLPGENNQDAGYMLYIKLKKQDGKILFGGDAKVPKGNFETLAREIEKLLDAILSEN